MSEESPGIRLILGNIHEENKYVILNSGKMWLGEELRLPGGKHSWEDSQTVAQETAHWLGCNCRGIRERTGWPDMTPIQLEGQRVSFFFFLIEV